MAKKEGKDDMASQDYSTWTMEDVHYMRRTALEMQKVRRMCGERYGSAHVFVQDIAALQRIIEITGADVERTRRTDENGVRWAYVAIDLDGVEFCSCTKVD